MITRTTMKYRKATIRRILIGAAIGAPACVTVAQAQGPAQSVQWSAATKPAGTVARGGKLSIELSASVLTGWHVYGFTQSPGGPIPLKIAIDDNPVLLGAGAISGTAPVKKHDAAFDLDIESYTGVFTLRVPVQVKELSVSGRQDVSVAVRFQACNDRTCLPPKTVHVPVPVEVVAGN